MRCRSTTHAYYKSQGRIVYRFETVTSAAHTVPYTRLSKKESLHPIYNENSRLPNLP